MQPKLIIFASGEKEPFSEKGGGSGFANLKKAQQSGMLNANIVGVVSNNDHGGVRYRAEQLDVPFIHFQKPWDTESYQRIVRDSEAEWVALSGWLKLVTGLDPKKTFNIHPALLSQLGGRFGGEGMYGHHVHEAVKKALDAGEITESGFTMHFVTAEYDRGPVFAEVRVPLRRGMTAEEIGGAVNTAEHQFQPMLTDLVIHGEISWDGKDATSLKTPRDLHEKLKVV
jgi:phosphoribosylglycinamide formyltransferase 1